MSDEIPNGESPKAGPPKRQRSSGGPVHGGKGNRNAIRHGLRAGKLPDDCAHVENQCNAMRRQLEDAVIAARGEVTLLDAANIQTALKWERHGALALRWMRIKAGALKPMEQLQFSREIAKASTERDRALAALRLDAKPEPISLTAYLEKRCN